MIMMCAWCAWCVVRVCAGSLLSGASACLWDRGFGRWVRARGMEQERSVCAESRAQLVTKFHEKT